LKKRGRGRWLPSRHWEEEETSRKAAENDKGDATPDLFLKYPDTTIATYI